MFENPPGLPRVAATGLDMRLFHLHYYKRYRMEIDLRRWSGTSLEATPGYEFTPWSAGLLEDHAEVKYLSFREEHDSVVFPCLSEHVGCRRLMREITSKRGFVPEATWLATYVGGGPTRREPCGTIQVIRVGRGQANVQNIGVTPLHRCRGIGAGLVVRALLGLKQLGVQRTQLEVTAKNVAAVRLYQRLGFRRVRTLYKAVEQDYSEAPDAAAETVERRRLV